MAIKTFFMRLAWLGAMGFLLTGCSGAESRMEETTQAQTVPMTKTETKLETTAEVKNAEEKIDKSKTPVKVKGIYVSAYAAGTRTMMDEILKKIDETEINAVVIDVKNDEGRITFEMEFPTADEIGACRHDIGDITELMKRLKDHGIYTIARVVAFRDPYLAEKRPEWSLKTDTGELYRDESGLAWIDPYEPDVWNYLTQIGEGAAKAGFDEVQFDYIRFAADKSMEHVAFDPERTKGRSRTEVIGEFTQYAYRKLSPLGIYVSADVFGSIMESRQDAGKVGQDYGQMAESLDYISPMIYPSHYQDGNFGLEHPDMQPYETIRGALESSKRVLAEKATKDEPTLGRQAEVRPWLQDFTASYLEHYISYGPEQVRAQIQAVYDSGYEEWILWNAACKYSWDGLMPAKGN